MPPDRGQRIANAIDSLIVHLIPTDSQTDEEEAQARHDAAFEAVASILDRLVLVLINSRSYMILTDHAPEAVLLRSQPMSTMPQT